MASHGIETYPIPKGILPITNDEYELEEREKRRKELESLRHHRLSFLNRAVDYFGKEEPNQNVMTTVAKMVEDFVQNILNGVHEKDPRFKGTLIACGSYYEGMKIKQPNEFDYIFELSEESLSQNDLHITHSKPDTFKPRKNEEIRALSYFKVFLKENATKLWAGKSSTPEKSDGCQSNEECNQELKPRDVQKEFYSLVKMVANDYILDTEDQNTTPNAAAYGEAHISIAGPAVTLHTKILKSQVAKLLNDEKEKKRKLYDLRIKIDITLAISVRVKEGEEQKAWPLEGTGDVTLDKDLLGADVKIDCCHLIPAGDFWRASFSVWELCSVLNETADNAERKRCFKALKQIRDKLAIGNDHDPDILATYPLKVSFLKEAQKNHEPEEWAFSKLSTRAFGILDSVEKQGSEGAFTSYFIKNDPVFMESDKSYLESKRLKQYLLKLNENYLLNGRIHTVVFIALWIIYMNIMSFSISFVSILSNEASDPEVCRHPPNLEKIGLAKYLFALMPLSFLAFTLNLYGILWIVFYKRFTVNNVVYKMYIGVKYIYIAVLLISIIIICLGLRLVASFYSLFECAVSLREMLGLTATILALSIFFVLAGIVHTTVLFGIMRCKCSHYAYEWIFFEELIRDFCCKKKDVPQPNQTLSLNGASYGRQLSNFDSIGGTSSPAQMQFENEIYDSSMTEDQVL